MRRSLLPWCFVVLLGAGAGIGVAAQASRDVPDVDDFFQLTDPDESRAAAARARIAAAWDDGYAAMIVDRLDLLRRTSIVNPLAWLRISRVAGFLEERTGQRFGADVNAWRDWVWSRPYDPHPDYGPFKGRLYKTLRKDIRCNKISDLRDATWAAIG
jgi:hypothetical protein